MKKFLALLLALVMALSCTAALAEAPAFQLPDLMEVLDQALESAPAMTLQENFTVNEDAVKNLLAMFGAPEQVQSIADLALSFVNNLGEKTVFADKGIQYDLQLKDQAVCSLALERTAEGFALVSNLVPSYKITVKEETVRALLGQLTEQINAVLSKVNMEQIQAAFMKIMQYAQEAAEKMQSVISMGEPVKGEYEFDGMTFNTCTPVNMDVKAYAEIMTDYVKNLMTDETIVGMLTSLQEVIPGMTLNLPSEEELAEQLTIPEDQLPVIEAYAYTNTDENLNVLSNDTYATITAATQGENPEELKLAIFVSEYNGFVDVQAPSQGIAGRVSIARTENGRTLHLSVPSMNLEADLSVIMTENGVALHLSVPTMNLEADMTAEKTEKGAHLSLSVPAMNLAADLFTEMDSNFCSSSLSVNYQGMFAAVVYYVAMAEEGMNGEITVYFNDQENPVLTSSFSLTEGGERTLTSVDDGKTELALETVLAGGSLDEPLSPVLSELQTSGFGILLGNVAQIMPEEVQSVMSLMNGGQSAVEEAPATPAE